MHDVQRSKRGRRPQAREHGGMGEGKGREERSVGLDGSEVAEAETTKPEGQGHLGRNRASNLTRPLDQGEHHSTQLGLHTSHGYVNHCSYI
jgi:hypothetical protein